VKGRPASTSLTVTFHIIRSGSPQVGASFDDFFLETEPVPEPSSLALVGAGALAMLRRRRRYPAISASANTPVA
jgi:hypothetical protein